MIFALQLAMGWTIRVSFPAGAGIFFDTMSRPALGPT